MTYQPEHKPRASLLPETYVKYLSKQQEATSMVKVVRKSDDELTKIQERLCQQSIACLVPRDVLSGVKKPLFRRTRSRSFDDFLNVQSPHMRDEALSNRLSDSPSLVDSISKSGNNVSDKILSRDRSGTPRRRATITSTSRMPSFSQSQDQRRSTIHASAVTTPETLNKRPLTSSASERILKRQSSPTSSTDISKKKASPSSVAHSIKAAAVTNKTTFSHPTKSFRRNSMSTISSKTEKEASLKRRTSSITTRPDTPTPKSRPSTGSQDGATRKQSRKESIATPQLDSVKEKKRSGSSKKSKSVASPIGKESDDSVPLSIPVTAEQTAKGQPSEVNQSTPSALPPRRLPTLRRLRSRSLDQETFPTVPLLASTPFPATTTTTTATTATTELAKTFVQDNIDTDDQLPLEDRTTKVESCSPDDSVGDSGVEGEVPGALAPLKPHPPVPTLLPLTSPPTTSTTAHTASKTVDPSGESASGEGGGTEGEVREGKTAEGSVSKAAPPQKDTKPKVTDWRHTAAILKNVGKFISKCRQHGGDGQRVSQVFSGPHLFWRARVNAIVHIYEHDDMDCFEVVCEDVDKKVFFNRLYVAPSYIYDIKAAAFQAKLNQINTHRKDLIPRARRSLAAEYIVSTLEVEKPPSGGRVREAEAEGDRPRVDICCRRYNGDTLNFEYLNMEQPVFVRPVDVRAAEEEAKMKSRKEVVNIRESGLAPPLV